MSTQTLFISYLLPAAVSLTVLWAVYRLLFSNSNRFQFNRFFLLTSMLFSIALPVLGTLAGQSSPQLMSLKEHLMEGFMLNEITITSESGAAMTLSENVTLEAAHTPISIWKLLYIIYIIGVAVTALIFIFRLIRLAVIAIRSPKRKMDGYTMVFTNKGHGAYSFFRYAFFNDSQTDPDIVRHELSHIEHHHSWDILIAEMMKIFQWFNPFMYLYKRELQSLHEYIADSDVVDSGADKKNYMMLILQQCTAVDFSNMSNNFSLILTKKRIKMITKNEKAKSLWWRLLATMPVLALLMVANTKVTAQEQKPEKNLLNVEIGEFELFNDDGTQMQLKDTVIYYEDGSYTKFESSEAPDPITSEMRKKFTATTCNADGTPNPNIHFTINEAENHGDTMRYKIEPFTISTDNLNKILKKRKDNDSIYNVVEEMPEYPGGVEKMMEFIVKNITYPQKAKDEGIQGRVFVSFVIEKDGSVSEVKVLRSIGEACDNEAVRVVKAMPKWKPGFVKGEPVRVRYNLPINFKLDDNKQSNGLEGTTWEGTGKGSKNKVNYTMKMTMEIESATSGYFVMTLTSEKKGKSKAEYEDVGLPFTYTYDGKSMGSINPIYPDGSTMTVEPPYGFTIDDKGNMIVNFYDFKEDIGVEKIVFSKTGKSSNTTRMSASEKDKVYDTPETMPEYIGGMDAMIKYLQENITVPEKYTDMDTKTTYRVMVKFVVETDGSVTEVETVRSDPSKKDLNDEAVRVVKGMPKWKPGTMKGKPVRVRYLLPVTYKLGK